MKNIICFLLSTCFLVFSWQEGSAQKRKNVGLGYFGETLTHPGLTAHLEFEQRQSDRVSTLLGTSLSAYVHRRNHTGFLLDGQLGFRRYAASGLVTEQYLGLGVMLSRYNGDGVFQRDDNGNIRRASSFANPDIIPSVTLGLGYNLSRSERSLKMLYVRPKVFWQIPFNNLALPHFALQAGYLVSLN